MELLLAGGTVISGTGTPPQRANVLIEDERIIAVGNPDEFGNGDGLRRVDCTGLSILPGLMDLHVHLMLDGDADWFAHNSERDTPGYLLAKMARNANRTLAAGFTLVREAGCKHFLSVDLREAVSKGVLPGPRVVAAQPIIMTGGHGYLLGAIEADGVDEVRKAARLAIKLGMDVVKVMATGGVMTPGVEPGSPQLTTDEIRAAVEEAHRAGKRTMTHAQGAAGIRNAVEAGIDCIEHGQYMGTDRELMHMMQAKDVAYVPTLCNNLCKVDAEARALEQGEAFPIPDWAMRKARTVLGPHQDTFEKAMEMGIRIGCGTDAGGPLNHHGENAHELEVMVRYGMSPLEAINTATLRSAQIIGLDRNLGSIEPGKYADLVLVRGDPSDDIRILRGPGNIDSVYLAGQCVAGRGFDGAAGWTKSALRYQT